jgi:hypothetical protein
LKSIVVHSLCQRELITDADEVSGRFTIINSIQPHQTHQIVSKIYHTNREAGIFSFDILDLTYTMPKLQ